MTMVASRDLRNHTADVLRQVSEGTPVTVTVNGRPVAEIRRTEQKRASFFTRQELAAVVFGRQADAALARDLELMAGETTDDLDPL